MDEAVQFLGMSTFCRLLSAGVVFCQSAVMGGDVQMHRACCLQFRPAVRTAPVPQCCVGGIPGGSELEHRVLPKDVGSLPA